MEYDENEDYDDERKGQLAALEHLAMHVVDPKTKGKVSIIAHTDRAIERVRQDGRISNSPDSYQEKAVARKAAQDMPVLLMLRQNGKQDKGWRDLPFWWPVMFVPQTAVTSVFAAEAPAEDTIGSASESLELHVLASHADAYLQKHLGADQKWSGINRAIWNALGITAKHTLHLTQITSLAEEISAKPDDVFAVIALLCGPGSRLLKMNFLSDSGELAEGSNTEVTRRLREWWRDKSIGDEDWKRWASGIAVEWTPANVEGKVQ